MFDQKSKNSRTCQGSGNAFKMLWVRHTQHDVFL